MTAECQPSEKGNSLSHKKKRIKSLSQGRKEKRPPAYVQKETNCRTSRGHEGVCKKMNSKEMGEREEHDDGWGNCSGEKTMRQAARLT